MKRSALLLYVLIVCRAAQQASAQAPPDATALFEQGLKDMDDAHYDIACKELAASLARYNDSGTKGALAECYTKLGQVATAWTLWRDLADTAASEDLRKDAASNAYHLEARLPHFVIRLKSTPAPGLAVTVADSKVADPTLAVPLPVDPGSFTVRATAPDHVTWTGTFTAVEGKVTNVEVPALAVAPKPRPAPASTSSPTTVIVRDDIESTRRSRHLLGLSLGVAGGASILLGGFFGLQARSHWNDAKTACQNMPDMCPAGAIASAQRDVDSARTDALASTIMLTVGGAAILGGVLAYLSAPSSMETQGTALQVAPSLSAHFGGLTISGGF